MLCVCFIKGMKVVCKNDRLYCFNYVILDIVKIIKVF